MSFISCDLKKLYILVGFNDILQAAILLRFLLLWPLLFKVFVSAVYR